jgi:hypothetical protein
MSNIAIAITLFVAIDAIVISSIFYVLGQSLRDLSNAFPTQTELPGTPRKEFQSMSIGLMNLGGCIHVSLDGNHLHLHPTRFARMMKMTTASIPLACIEAQQEKPLTRKSTARGLAAVKLRSAITSRVHEANLPAWAVAAVLALREPASSDDGEQSSDCNA